MKTLNSVLSLVLVGTLGLTYLVRADDPLDQLSQAELEAELERIAPLIEPPQEFSEEGMETRTLTAEEVNALLPYASDSRLDLQELLDRIKIYPRSRQITELRTDAARILNDSGNRNSELLMRFALMRTIKIVDIAEKNSSGQRALKEWKLKFLKSGIQMAIGFFESDAAYAQRLKADPASRPDYVGFGLVVQREFWSYAHRLTSLQAQYSVYRISLALLMWDLFREEALRKSYAASIIRIHRILKDIPETAPTDSRELRALIQVMKSRIKSPLRIAGNQRYPEAGSLPRPIVTPIRPRTDFMVQGGEMITCRTSSNGYEFSNESRDRTVAISELIDECASYDAVSDAECKANVSCNDGLNYPKMMVCTTSSNGYEFSNESRSRDVAISGLVSECTSYDEVSDAECKANVLCKANE